MSDTLADLVNRVATLETQQEIHKRLLLGTWENDPQTGVPVQRAPGVLERIRDLSDQGVEILKQIKKRDDDSDKTRKAAIRTAWKMALPLITGILIIAFFSAVDWLAKHATEIRGVLPHAP